MMPHRSWGCSLVPARYTNIIAVTKAFEIAMTIMKGRFLGLGGRALPYWEALPPPMRASIVELLLIQIAIRQE
jgi:hypothetical protein